MNDVLDKEILALDRLIEILIQEFHNLKNKDTVAAQKLLAEKQHLLSQIDNLTNDHEYLLLGEKLPNTGKSMSAYLNKQQGHNKLKLSEKWHYLVKRLEECRALNHRNGQYINLSRDFVQQALATLRGQPHRSSATVCYEATGKSGATLDGKSIGKI